MSKFRSFLETLKTPIKKLGEKVGSPFKALEKEARLGPVLHADVMATLELLKQKHPEAKKVLKEATGFAVIPSIGRASLVLGGAYGLGEVFEAEKVIGYAAIVELTIGVQVGGTTFHEIVVFHDKGSLDRFKAGKYAFAADAGVEIVKAGAQAGHGFGASSSIYILSDGGMLLDLAIGGQKFIFRQAGLGRFRTAEGKLDEKEPGEKPGEKKEEELQPEEEQRHAQEEAEAEVEPHDEEEPAEHPHH